MNPNQIEQTKYLTDLILALNPLFIGIFIFGILTGVFFFSSFFSRLDRLSSLMRFPRRIKVYDQINDLYLYVYRFKGKYYSVEEYDRRRAIARNKFLNKRNLSL